MPIAEVAIEVRSDYVGRNVGHFSVSLTAADKEVARATAIVQRQVATPLPVDLPGHPLPQAPRSVDESEPARFPFKRDLVGYADFVELRVARGDFFRGPCATWFRMRHPLVAGETPSAIERVAVAADSGNGISAVLDFRRYLFVNSDLTINLLRPPRGEWICIDAQTLVGEGGGGVAEARIFDAEGLVGRSTQSLSIRARD